jgi:hypothetical protein
MCQCIDMLSNIIQMADPFGHQFVVQDNNSGGQHSCAVFLDRKASNR